MDEPTASLTRAEVDALLAVVRRLQADGMAIVFVSHKLDEVLRVSQRIAILRGGKLVAELPAEGADKALLAETMVGRQVQMPQRQARHLLV
jgi:simple sugar transport system ATP-binding protein